MKEERRLLWLAIAALVLFAAGATVALTRSHEAPGDVVDKELLAFLSEARALHHEANLEENSGKFEDASRSMDRLLAARRPHDGPEVEEVLADAYARLAELQLRQGRLEPAAAAVASGLAHAPAPTYFRGHLVEVEGLVEEARAAELADAGRTTEAAAARAKAISLLEDVVKIQDQVIQTSLGDGGAK